jgi:hypothetical protein
MRYQQFASHAYFGAAGPVSNMASEQEKAFCVLRFEVSRTVTTVQRGFHAPFKKRRTTQEDRLFGLVVRVLGYRSGGPGSIPGTNQKKCSGSGTGCTQPREYKLRSYLIEK